MIYATPYNTTTRECTAASAETGFRTLDEAAAAAGRPSRRYAGMLIYPGVVFTKFPWRVDRPDKCAYAPTQSTGDMHCEHT